MNDRGVGFWVVQGPGWALLVYLIVAQGIPAFDYEIGISMGTQESAAAVTEVGVAFWKGFAIGDLVTYIPLLAGGLTLHWRNHRWARSALAAALGITVYWPVVCLAAAVSARGADGWKLPSETAFWMVLPLISLWGAFALWRLTVEHRKGEL